MENSVQSDFSAQRFLVVDDKPFLRNLIHGMLVRCHAGDIVHAGDGVQALDILSAGKMNFVLCDWNMAPMNGLELLRSLRAGQVMGVPRDVRFVMLTGYGDEKVVRAAIDMGVNGYIVKPVSHGRLVQAIQAALAYRMVLKPEEAYQAMAAVAMPGNLPEESKPIPPWVLLSKMRSQAKAEASRHIEQIMRGQASPPDERAIVNEETLVIDDILAGRVLAENVFNESGRLLLTRGTVLDRQLLWRLKELAAATDAALQLRIGDFAE